MSAYASTVDTFNYSSISGYSDAVGSIATGVPGKDGKAGVGLNLAAVVKRQAQAGMGPFAKDVQKRFERGMDWIRHWGQDFMTFGSSAQDHENTNE